MDGSYGRVGAWSLHTAVLALGAIVGWLVIRATKSDPPDPSDPLAIQYDLTFLQSPSSFDQADVASLKNWNDRQTQAKLTDKGWKCVVRSTTISPYGVPVNWHAVWRQNESNPADPIIENSVMLKSKWTGSKTATELIVYHNLNSFQHHISLAPSESRAIKINAHNMKQGLYLFLVVRTNAIRQAIARPLVPSAGGATAHGAGSTDHPSR